jgi:hypothetical protein
MNVFKNRLNKKIVALFFLNVAITNGSDATDDADIDAMANLTDEEVQSLSPEEIHTELDKSRKRLDELLVTNAEFNQLMNLPPEQLKIKLNELQSQYDTNGRIFKEFESGSLEELKIMLREQQKLYQDLKIQLDALNKRRNQGGVSPESLKQELVKAKMGGVTPVSSSVSPQALQQQLIAKKTGTTTPSAPSPAAPRPAVGR